ncbi:hypothetical protein NHQ30_010563 [Ciborinia camelliae]|nr:hypothetical protein NHQ30_010563 [Ciborinia camelliae]
MQFNVLALTIAAMASVAVATETVTVYACPSATGVSSGVTSSGVAAPSVASTGVVTSPTGTTSPIAYATGAAGHMQVSAFGMVVAGAVALVCLLPTISPIYLSIDLH